MDIEWVFYRVLLIGGGYLILNRIREMSKEDLAKKCGKYGYMLYKKNISRSAAYWDCFFTVIKTPLVLTGFVAVLAGYGGSYIWETIIVASVVLIPPSIIPISKFLKEIEENAEKNYKDD